MVKRDYERHTLSCGNTVEDIAFFPLLIIVKIVAILLIESKSSRLFRSTKRS